jgi:hypothetical protein
MRLDFGFHGRWNNRRPCITSNPDKPSAASPADRDPKETDMLLPWTSTLILFSISYGLFVLIAVRGLCGLIADQLTALRTARAEA